MPLVDLIFATGPILLLIFLMTKKTPMPSAKALPLAALVAYGIQFVWFGTGASLVHASVLAGLLVALTPIMIVWGAIFLFRTMEHSGAMGTIRCWLNHLSRNRVAQVVIIGWSFQFLIEGASGFGTPAALAGPLLVGLGFPPLRVAMACLILNSIPVSFGAVGTPTWFGFGQLGLSPEEFRAVAWKTALIHSAAACAVPLLAFRLLVSWQEIRRNLVFIILALASSVVPMLALSRVNDEFPAVAGGLLGLIFTVGLARHKVGLTRDDDHSAAEEPGEPPSARAVVKALFPLWATVLVLLATRIPQIGLRDLLTSAVPAWNVPLGIFGSFSISPALVLKLHGIFGTPMDWTHQLLYVPSLIPFVLISVVTWKLLDAPAGTARKVWQESTTQMRNPILALLGALVLVQLLMVGGEQSAVMLIGHSLAGAVGGWWQYLAAFLGALGSFFAGSCTISNLTFGPIQDSIATQMNLDRTTILALQSVGGAMGNMIAIHNIVAVCSVLGLGKSEGEILKKTVVAMLLYGAIAAAMAAIL
ncbi:L-lactate permease [Phragmitibacter flavus]|uniref:L-lactate permease n=1 Tax=Phragmitibacter flavus TaxID=2576071 RepID=A0A5R8KA05_9BACT|nr:L-lactate permease [Phragmitibacter flavus]TLD69097.1 L-lactate permease [Phragmitibacter flavus]